MPYTLQWTFSLERQVLGNFVLKAVCVGTRGINLFTIYNANQQPIQIVNGRQFTPADAGAPNSNFASFRYVAPISNQHYHAGQFVVEKRFSKGCDSVFTTRWPETLIAEAEEGSRGPRTSGAPISAFSTHTTAPAGKGLSAFHIQHNLIFSYTYELPFGPGHRWGTRWPTLLDRLLGGWVINGTNTIRGGLPVRIGGSSRQSRYPAEYSDRPDLRPGGNNNPVQKHWTPEQCFDPTQFVLQPPGFFAMWEETL